MTTAGILDDQLAQRARALHFRAKGIVSSLRSGLHKSPHHGASMVFAEHREYRPGDDPRRLDWRAYARTDRPVIRRFEQEAQLRAHLIHDRSASMNWRGFEDKGPTKGEYGALLLATVAHLLSAQGDAIGFRALHETSDSLRPSARRSQLLTILERLVGSTPHGAPMTLTESLTSVAATMPHRSLVVIASDMLHVDEDLGAIPWSMLSARGREVILFHVLHADEISPPRERAALFHGLEDEGEVEADMAQVAERYEGAMEAFRQDIRSRCERASIRYVDATMSRAPAEVLAAGLWGSR